MVTFSTIEWVYGKKVGLRLWLWADPTIAVAFIDFPS
jgi:hypothetical protein